MWRRKFFKNFLEDSSDFVFFVKQWLKLQSIVNELIHTDVNPYKYNYKTTSD